MMIASALKTKWLCILVGLVWNCQWSHGFALDPFEMPSPLYNSSDPITLLDVTTIKSVILNSDKAWLVEFYSSWCGHCQHFAPTYRQLANEVKNWNSVIGVAAIDCAVELNLPSCRDFEIMGYPTMILFPPKANMTSLSTYPNVEGHEVNPIKTEMINFVAKVQANNTFADKVNTWPMLAPFNSNNVQDLWPDKSDQFAPLGILILDSKEAPIGAEVMMACSSITSKLPQPVLFRRVLQGQIPPSLETMLPSVDGKLPQMFSFSKDLKDWGRIKPASEALSDYVLAFKEFAGLEVAHESAGPQADIQPKFNAKITHNPKMLHSEAAIKRRRYSVFMADLEKTVIYSLAHEIAQHQMIAGEALATLQEYLDVLVEFFPFNSRRKDFEQVLRTIRDWIVSHEDAVLGEDISNKVKDLEQKFPALADHPNGWIGCKGSEPRYGGYPCGLWTLFHSLTVSQSERKSEDPKTVLNMMVKFISHFFSCRECARHFGQASQDGKAVEDEVKSYEDAVLWLWKTHNKVNQRLSGDISDDPVFPKETFPNRQHCTDCYDDKVTGYDLWREFRRDRVLEFITEMHNDISLEGLSDFNPIADSGSNQHDLVVVSKPSFEAHVRERLVFGRREKLPDRHQYTQDKQGSIFSPADISIGFLLYSVSAFILVVVYFKFVAKKRCSSCVAWLFTMGSRSMNDHRNPLLGKV